jgi:hypothetical protein
MGWHEVGPATTLIPCSGHTWPSYTWPSSSSLVAEALLSPLPASSPFSHLLLSSFFFLYFPNRISLFIPQASLGHNHPIYASCITGMTGLRHSAQLFIDRDSLIESH